MSGRSQRARNEPGERRAGSTPIPSYDDWGTHRKRAADSGRDRGHEWSRHPLADYLTDSVGPEQAHVLGVGRETDNPSELGAGKSRLSAVRAPRGMDEPRWLVDEMLGRLARYLRFLGYDAAYVRNSPDEEIVRRARAEHRRLITRDRALAMQLADAVFLARTDIAGQMAELRKEVPSLRTEVKFDRCSLCNGLLHPVHEVPPGSVPGEIPAEVRNGQSPLYACAECGHLYWEGSHTASVRKRLRAWSHPEPGTG